ncbi:MAG: amino acid adenylation domain-containing protein, partial [Paraglaciecola sp.]
MDSTLTHANASSIIFTPGIDLPKTHAINMVECLRYLARVRPNDSALITVKASGEGHFSYQQLEDKVKGLAAILQQKFIPGDRALILHDNDEHYVVSFLACLYTGLVAVPIFPPESMREKHLERLLAIAEDAQPVCLLTASTFFNLLDKNVPGLSQVQSIAVDQVESNLAAQWQDYNPTNDDIAFLQYTSGSTAAPKGVMVSHGNLFANEIAMEKGFSVTQDDVFVSWLPLYHDMGLIGGLLQPLFIGIPVVLMSPTFFLEKPIRWLEAISHYRGTVSGGPDFSYRLCIERIKPKQMKALDLSCWRLAFSGAEPIRHDTLAQFSDKFSSNGFSENSLCPCYGLAEATLYVAGSARGQGMLANQFCDKSLSKNTVQASSDGAFLVSCGHTADDHQIAIMAIDSKGEIDFSTNEKTDEIGEIWVSGPSIAQGYWRNAEATAETFVEYNGKRWIRTGDLGFVYQQQLYITGRMKDLIILRGHNLYPQDIERAIEAECDFVRKGRVAAFSVTKPDGSEGIGLALEVPNSLKKLIPAATLFDALGETISTICREFMAVAVLLNPGALPKTSSGKLQRSACRSGWKNSTLDSYALFEFGCIVDQNADVNVNKSTSTKEFSPQDKTEVILAKIWAEVLSVERVDRNDNFFALGGNSVRVLQVTASAEQAGIKIAPKTVFENPSIAALSKQINIEQASINYSEILPLTSAEKQQVELSFAQSRQWFLWQLSPESSAYHISGALNFSGTLDIAAVKTSFNKLVERHESLRTIFKAKGDGLALQVIQPQLTLEMPVIDLTHLSVEAQHYAAKKQADEWHKTSFDLTTGPLVRIGLIKLAEKQHIMVLVIHHIIADGWSIQVFLKEFTEQYQAIITDEKLVLPELAIQYADYAVWQRNWLQADELDKQLSYWQAHLGDKQPVLRMKTDKPRLMAAEYTQASHSWVLPSEIAHKLSAVASEHQSTVFMALLSAFQTLLYRYTGQEDLRVGVPTANRHRSEVAGVIGFFVNTQVLRGVVNSRMPLHKVLAQVKAAALGAQANQELPFEKLVEALHPERSLNHTPLFQVMHNHQQNDGYSFLSEMSGLELSEYELGGKAAQFELTLETTETEQGDVFIRFNYAKELFATETIVLMGEYYQRIVQAFAENIEQAIGDIRLISDIEYKSFFTQGNNPTRYTNNSPVHQLIEQQVTLTPNAIALVFAEEQLTYLELNQQANQLAHYLIAQGIKPEDKVGIAVERSIDMVVSLLAVLKTGGAYVPLDPDYPQERLAYIMEDSDIQILLSDSKQLSGLPELPHGPTLCLDKLDLGDDQTTNPNVNVHNDNLAYLIYTSGSTGKPKGVMVRHGALSNFLNSMQKEPGLTSDDTLVAVTSLSFDIAALELYLPLLSGAKLVLATREDVLEGHALAKLIEKAQATVLQSTPSGWRLLLASGWQPKTVESNANAFKGLCGGEALPQDLAQELRLHGVDLWNMYGPTETTIWSAVKQLSNNVPTLGLPIADTQLHILDNELNPTPKGVAGELYISGSGLARGYAERADLTTLAFIANPFSDSGERLYRTGDLACWSSEGELEYLGRIDHQVKIRGFRIELGEIETALLSQPEIHEAVVIAKENKSGAQLIAYVSTHSESSSSVKPVKVDVTQIKAQLSKVLPDYMVPAVILVLPTLPKTPNGKVDRKSLPDAELSNVNQYEAPEGEVETLLAEIWSEVLGVEKVGRHDNFFELGGDSINSLRLVSKINQKLGCKRTVRNIFEQQVLKSQALLVIND